MSRMIDVGERSGLRLRDWQAVEMVVVGESAVSVELVVVRSLCVCV